MAGACCFFNIGRVSDVLDVYPLMVIDKENNTFGCPDNFADLVFSLILKQSALLVEAVGFVDDKHVESVGWRVVESAGSPEHIVNLVVS